ncbi:MAG TPA: hypothetical protein DCL74_03800 [Succinivibrionaceae bacterium]|nr:hypothetical protein [Succinivibrionaceae bacterium]
MADDKKKDPEVLTKKRFPLKRSVIIAGVCGSLCFAAGCFFLYQGLQTYFDSGSQNLILEGLHALENNDTDTASNRFIRVFSEDNKDSVSADFLAWMEAKKGNFDKALLYARRSIELSKQSSSCELMGYLALLGRGKAKGAEAACYYFEQAALQIPIHEREARFRDMLEYAISLCQTRADYIRMVKKAAEQGSALGILLLGDLEFLGEGTSVSPQSATAAWEEARRLGRNDALVRIAMQKWYGIGVKRKIDEALNMLKEAADRKEPLAMYDLALIKLRQEQSGSSAEGLKLMQQAASLKFGPAITALGILTLHLDSSKEGMGAALSFFKRAYEAADDTGSAFYAFMLYEGLGTRADQIKGQAILHELKRRGISSVKGIYDYLSSSQHSGEEALQQMAMLCSAQYFAEIVFDEGDPLAPFYSKNVSGKNPGVFFTPMHADFSLDSDLIHELGSNYIIRNDEPDEIKIQGKKLYSPHFSSLLQYYNPSAGAKKFVPATVTAILTRAPALPSAYDNYHIDVRRINAWSEVEGFETWYLKSDDATK